MGLTNTEREYKYDTMRFLLMFLVIAGHATELFLSGWTVYVYKIIYTFHMPGFMFLTGKYARFDKKHVIKHLCLPYVIFQAIYLCFDAIVMTEGKIRIQFHTPYWILWYLLAIIFCYAIIPFLPEKESIWAVLVILGAFVISIFIGYESTIGYYLTLSRFIVFLPFFLFGYYHDAIVKTVRELVRVKAIVILILSAVIILVGEFIIIYGNFPIKLLYGSYGYEACESSAIARLLVFITAIAWIEFLSIVIPNVKVRFISTIGKSTMPIFVLHAFVIKLLGKFSFFHFSQGVNFILACAVAMIIMVIFGNSAIAKVFKKVF